MHISILSNPSVLILVKLFFSGKYNIYAIINVDLLFVPGNGGDLQWCFSQVKGTIEEDVTEGITETLQSFAC